MSKIGVVTIGRNEGSRLEKSLLSLLGKVQQIVYVDSGSTDGSVQLARALGVSVVELDLSIPFTAARARNAGFYHLLQLHPDLEFVQFVDGDCEVINGWIEKAVNQLEIQPDLAVVCGRRRERFPEVSIYNQLCDIEWNTPIGEAKACGGDAMMRVKAVQEVGGFNESLIAGEEPELCVRLRQNKWKILRMDAEMTLHDAQMLKLSQWWKRNVRAGHAFAEGAAMHGGEPERHWVKESRSNWLWGLLVPTVAILMAFVTHGWSLLLFLTYPLLSFRIYRYMRHTLPQKPAAIYAFFCVLGKLPQVQGQLQFYLNRLFNKRSTLVEYKTAL
ncbi:MAG TPA: glycosyltransferase family A protein [Halomicronema sp.]